MKINLDSPPEEVQIQIIPLIDVIFCILTFFILAALQLTRQQAITIDLPKASTGSPIPGIGSSNTRFREMLVVSITPTGQTFVDKNPVDRSQLAQVLGVYLRQNPNGIVVLNASPNSFYNDVIQVLDLMRAVGGDRVALATTPTTSSPTSPTQSGTSPFPGTNPTLNPFDPFRTNPSPSLSPSPAPGASPGALSPGAEGTFDPFASPSPAPSSP